MSKQLGILVLFFGIGSGLASAQNVFEGAAFSVVIPEGFSVEPSMQSNTSPEEFDSVKIHSADGLVTFYVFAPRYGGMPADILLKPGVEALVEERGSETEGLIHSWWTIRDKTRTYSRSYHSRMNIAGTDVTIFGIQYSDGLSLENHLEAYKEFKASFERKPDS